MYTKRKNLDTTETTLAVKEAITSSKYFTKQNKSEFFFLPYFNSKKKIM